jgi:hypothetical protein
MLAATIGLTTILVRARPARASESVAGEVSPLARRGPGCDLARTAIEHFGAGIPVARPRGRAPVPCATVVGITSEAADVGVTRAGNLFYAPRLDNTAPPPQNTLQGPEFVVRSADSGATWTPLDSGGPTTSGLVPPWMSVDPDTNRIWFVTALPSLCGARISWSDDEGDTWQTNPSVGCPAQGGEKLLEGPAPAGGARPVGYSHVVYYCANSIDIAASNLYCYRSLDGGRTFAFTGSFPDPMPPVGCAEHHPSRPGLVGPDGALYFPTTLCGALGVAISRDEGASWQFGSIADSGFQDIYTTSTAADARGNLYFAWRGPGALPYLSISTDRGATWRPPIMVAPPGVQAVRRVALAARRRGKVALAYLGTTDGIGFSGYITETRNALARRPRFWSAPVNDPASPLINASDAETFGDRFFYGNVTIGRGSTPWAGFHCAKATACPGQRLGVVGRLARGS